jgi:hypothetical protein
LVVVATAGAYEMRDVDLAGDAALDRALRAAEITPPVQGVPPTRPTAPIAKPSGETNG